MQFRAVAQSFALRILLEPHLVVGGFSFAAALQIEGGVSGWGSRTGKDSPEFKLRTFPSFIPSMLDPLFSK